MSVTEINLLTRDGGTGKNVYVAIRGSAPNRITRARKRNGRMQVRLLWSGEWFTVDCNATVWAE